MEFVFLCSSSKTKEIKKARHNHDASENDALNWNHFDPYFKKPVLFGSVSLTTEMTLLRGSVSC